MWDTYYILVGKEPIKAEKEAYEKWFAQAITKGETDVNTTVLDGGEGTPVKAMITTKFHGINQNPFRNGRPFLFQTQLMEGGHLIHTENFSTWAGAEGGHQRIVKKYLAGTLFEK